MSLLHTIEDDIVRVAGSVEQHVHDILAHHLTFAKVAAHVAHVADQLQQDPLVQAAEAAILPPGVRTALAEVLAKLDGELAKLTAPVPAAVLPEPQVAADTQPDLAPAEAQAS